MALSAGSAVVDSAAGVELARFLGNIGTAIAATTGLSLSSVTGEGAVGAQQTGESGSENADRWFEEKASMNANILTCLTNVHSALSSLLKCDLEQGRAYVLLARSFQNSALQEVDVRLTKKINLISQIHEGLRANYQERHVSTLSVTALCTHAVIAKRSLNVTAFEIPTRYYGVVMMPMKTQDYL
ncbi:hypothetical protein SARC_03036 [Sphaeroforma arctica JP610]|uniref:Uncharacterized protein n=1 Tax=Sphaeroforma arctica JP610 TaxID=667725 RepID=A0A0L0G6X1_9EUKA|nr:hypothetical protein SARC_03036 [Sphaeroforma arctica JP610]KNC84765.1 hypothetical protein SARC_03036 [Sphaeroforma arctica JP610]|eukprot:XP_014158667.1 hypothetical protein SARC_03036 [Sphaeroforma arctica JP610]